MMSFPCDVCGKDWPCEHSPAMTPPRTAPTPPAADAPLSDEQIADDAAWKLCHYNGLTETFGKVEADMTLHRLARPIILDALRQQRRAQAAQAPETSEPRAPHCAACGAALRAFSPNDTSTWRTDSFCSARCRRKGPRTQPPSPEPPAPVPASGIEDPWNQPHRNEERWGPKPSALPASPPSGGDREAQLAAGAEPTVAEWVEHALAFVRSLDMSSPADEDGQGDAIHALEQALTRLKGGA